MTVYLVGAGPGDPELLTVKAARLLAEADVMVHDRLVDHRVLALAPQAQWIDVGKAPGSPINPQGQINDLLVELGHRHSCVVRLKGGDPFVFGRGGEEAEALLAAGLTVEIVPGISAAIAAPAAAGIPVTHRGLSSGFTVVTAHQDPSSGDPGLDWDALARLGTTLVVLMGASRAGGIARRLLAAGTAPETPVAVITEATWPSQITQRTTLAGLGALTIANPATMVIGDVAGLALASRAQLAPILAHPATYAREELSA